MSLRQLVLTIIPFALLIVLGLLIMPGNKRDSIPVDHPDFDDVQVLTIATGTDSNKELDTAFEPFLDFLNEKLHANGLQMDAIVFDSNAELHEACRNGKVDLYLESPFPVYCAVQQGRMRPVARQWKNGVENYHSVILAKESGNLKHLADLEGHVLAVEDSGSSSSYGLPIADVLAIGLAPREINPDTDTVGWKEVGFQYSRSDSLSIRWLLESTVDAAAVSSVYYEEIAQDIGTELVVIHETKPIPRYLLAVREDLPAPIEQIVLDILLGLETYPEGRQAMAALWDTRRFDLIPYEKDLRERMFSLIKFMPCDQ